MAAGSLWHETSDLLAVGPTFTRPACRYLLRARVRPQQQTRRRPPLLLSTDRHMDGQTDGRTQDRFVTLSAY